MKTLFLIAACIMLVSFKSSKSTTTLDETKNVVTDTLITNNPMYSRLYFSINCHVRIIDSDNVKVLEQIRCNMVDISSLDIGVYKVQLSNEKGQLLKETKLLIE